MEVSDGTNLGRKKLCRVGVKKPSDDADGKTIRPVDSGVMDEVQSECTAEESSAQEDSDYHSAGHSDVSRNVSSSSEATSHDGESLNVRPTPLSRTDPDPPEDSPVFLQLLDFSLRLGYTEAQLRCVLTKLGKVAVGDGNCPSQDKILGELIKLGQEVECDRRPAAVEKVPESTTPMAICPYGRKCTYGRKCRFGHPERSGTPMRSVTERLFDHHKKLSPSNSAEPERSVAASRLSPKELLCRSASNPPGLPSRLLCHRKKNVGMAGHLYPTVLINHHYQHQRQLDEQLHNEDPYMSTEGFLHPAYLTEQYGRQRRQTPLDDNGHTLLTRHISNPEEILAAINSRLSSHESDLVAATHAHVPLEHYWSYPTPTETATFHSLRRHLGSDDFHSSPQDGPPPLCSQENSLLRRQQVSRVTSFPESLLRTAQMRKNSRSDTYLNRLTEGTTDADDMPQWPMGQPRGERVAVATGNYYMPSTEVWGPLENSLQPTLESLSLCDPFLPTTES